MVYDVASFEEIRYFFNEGKAIVEYIPGYATVEEIDDVLRIVQVYFIMGATLIPFLSSRKGR